MLLLRSIAHNLLHLWRLTGRDPRRLFWPWALSVAGVATVALCIVWARPWLVLFGMARAYHGGEWGATLDLAGDDFGGWAEPMRLIDASRGVIVAAFTLVLPGMVRRLHDVGRSGLWVVPVPLLAWAAAMPWRLDTLAPADLAMLLVPLIAPSLLSLAVMILGVMLLIESDPAPNRFGPPGPLRPMPLPAQ